MEALGTVNGAGLVRVSPFASAVLEHLQHASDVCLELDLHRQLHGRSGARVVCPCSSLTTALQIELLLKLLLQLLEQLVRRPCPVLRSQFGLLVWFERRHYAARAAHVLPRRFRSLCALTPLYGRVQAVGEHVLLLNESLVDRVLDSQHLFLALEGLGGGLRLHDPLKLGLQGRGQVLGQDGGLLHTLGFRAERTETGAAMATLARRLPRELAATTGHGSGLRLELRVHDVDLLPVRDESLAWDLLPRFGVLRPVELKGKPLA